MGHGPVQYFIIRLLKSLYECFMLKRVISIQNQSIRNHWLTKAALKYNLSWILWILYYIFLMHLIFY